MSQRALARALGLTAGRVSQLRKQGMPVDSVEAAEAWRRQRLDAGTVKIEKPSAALEALRKQKLEHEVAAKKQQVMMQEIAIDRELGILLLRADAEKAMRDLGTAVRAALENFAGQTAPLCVMVDLAHAYEVLDEQCRLVLVNIAEQVAQAAKKL